MHIKLDVYYKGDWDRRLALSR